MPKLTKKTVQSIVSGDVAVDSQTLTTYSRDTSLFEVTPQMVVYPKDTADIKKLVKYASQNQGVSLTARSGGTDMTGGPLTKSIVVDVNRYLNQVVNVSDCCATVQPGAFYRDFEAATLQQNLLLPSYPASREICTVGGMVANNSGGEKTLAYGQTRHYVKELKAVLSDGNEYTLAPLSAQQLETKKQQDNFEGNIYRQLHQLIADNYDTLQHIKPRVSKNSAGYALWDVWNKEQDTFDLTQLITGSQGTLGIITEITFRLITPKPHATMLVIFLDDLKDLGKIVTTVLRYQPESFESYDNHTLKLSLKFLPDIARRLSTKNFFKLALSFLPEFRLLITGGLPKLILIAEFTGDDTVELAKRAQAAKAAIGQFDLKAHITKNEQEAEKYWVMRRESFAILRQHVDGKRTAPFIDDIIVTPQQLPEFLPRLDDIMDNYDITYTVAGHIGDANFHIIPLMDVSRPDLEKIIRELSEKVYDLVLEYGGSITAEHNDGLVRTPFLEKMYGPEVYGLFKQTKQILDPQNIFNPGKKVNADWEEAMSHLIHKND